MDHFVHIFLQSRNSCAWPTDRGLQLQPWHSCLQFFEVWCVTTFKRFKVCSAEFSIELEAWEQLYRMMNPFCFICRLTENKKWGLLLALVEDKSSSDCAASWRLFQVSILSVQRQTKLCSVTVSGSSLDPTEKFTEAAACSSLTEAVK